MRTHTIFQRHTIDLPRLCAWCGRRPDERIRQTRLSHRTLWMRIQFIVSLPICSRCDAYVHALEQAQQWLWILSIALWGPISAVAIRAWTGPLNRVDDWLTFTIGVALITVVMAWASQELLKRTGLRDRWARAWIGEPPSGYASHSDVPGTFVPGETVRFYSAEFQRRFAELNPKLVQE